MISWILFFQTPRDTVKFITNEDASYQVLGYQKFKDFISQFTVANRGLFNKHLDSFHTVLLDCEKGTWREIKPEIKAGSFKEMLKLNPSEEEAKEKEREKDPVLKKKEFLKRFFDFRKKSVIDDR